MIWNDLPLESVITRNLFYFDESKKDTCVRICKKLEIDCFPDLSEDKFWIFEDDVWKPNEINDSLTEIYNPFDKKLLDLYKSNHSNIVFVSSNSMVDGIIHFTNYENENVFSNLYRNLHVYEKSLRSHIISLDLNFDYLLNYLENRRIESNDKDESLRFERMITKVKKKGVNLLNPYQELDFGELLNFSVSSYHSNELIEKIGLKKLKKENISISDIRDFRNVIMHHKQVSGENWNKLHNFDDFEIFFMRVLKFRKAFFSLSKTIDGKALVKKKVQNLRKLELIDQMKDSEIKEFFFTNY